MKNRKLPSVHACLTFCSSTLVWSFPFRYGNMGGIMKELVFVAVVVVVVVVIVFVVVVVVVFFSFG